MFILGVDVGIKEVDIPCQFSMVKGLCTVNVAWEEQANGPEGAYCRVCNEGERVLQIEADGEKSDVRGHGAG